MKLNTILYHANHPDIINEFITKRNLIISNHYDDANWCGKGMYFWDNKGNAIYWKNQGNNKKIIKLIASYDESEILDLTDLEIEKTVNNIIEGMNTREIISQASIGDKIDKISEMLDLNIVKVMGFYPKTPQTKLLKKSRLTNKNKLIYCIKESGNQIIDYSTIEKVN
ncbi:hypothetical protein [Globicatella sanguinis]|uniref:hypothetical protein n=1 Tax=Globicatella sanguinis TaxID=13076 RepID=UPI0025430F02|nr:hypothetical protein [Globicatella sanguinis]MDK7631754.1 hypothetical protein [Globicatella sanguinis]WIK66449.1 hypothetical protein CYJ72_011120 [Globicatella sanguinis]WKT55854.1 hypothetical protein Q3C38_11120 [Globicatella sanguinis]